MQVCLTPKSRFSILGLTLEIALHLGRETDSWWNVSEPRAAGGHTRKLHQLLDGLKLREACDLLWDFGQVT